MESIVHMQLVAPTEQAELQATETQTRLNYILKRKWESLMSRRKGLVRFKGKSRFEKDDWNAFIKGVADISDDISKEFLKAEDENKLVGTWEDWAIPGIYIMHN